MKFEKEYITERAKFFDGLAKYAFAFTVLLSSGLGALLLAKEKLSPSYFVGLFILDSIAIIFTGLFLLFIVLKYYQEIEKLR